MAEIPLWPGKGRERGYALSIHRKEQWDLGRHASLIPLVCVHWHHPEGSTRLFCAWKWGVLIRRSRRHSVVLERKIDSVIREASL